MSKEEMIAEIDTILWGSEHRDVEEIYWTVKEELG